jgi:hypothetical protein
MSCGKKLNQVEGYSHAMESGKYPFRMGKGVKSQQWQDLYV